MCGIFGIVARADAALSRVDIVAITERLFRYSETRGREAAGIALRANGSIDVLKQAGSASDFIKSPRYRNLLGNALETLGSNGNGSRGDRGALALVGHSRLVTNGFQCDDDNNQPVVVPRMVGVHNGIVTNEEALWDRYPALERRFTVDTEVILRVFRHHLDSGLSPQAAAGTTFSELKGAASIGVLVSDAPTLVLATNTGALFYIRNEGGTFFAFASERFILQRLADEGRLEASVGACTSIQQVVAGSGVLVDMETLNVDTFALIRDTREASPGPTALAPALDIVDHTKRVRDLRRCTRCIMPESYPLIDFDEDGVCNFCRHHVKIAVRGEEALREAVEPYRSKDGSADCIVAFSGGRDSSYGLHYIKNVLGMNPIAFTYDWGMVTDLARRNCARICGSLGVEHVLRSADIAQKRRFVRQQVEAWLKRPELGMVTLFTAGDKEFYKYARELRKETGIKLVFFCAGNMIENAPYKFGFLNIREDRHEMKLTAVSLRDKLAMLWYYVKQVALNPRYINRSLFDAMKAYWHTFVAKDDFLYLYHYVPFDENVVLDTIRGEYDWEDSPDTATTWRIGDGTAAFYNYIYHTMSGFTEDDDMLSNMVREGNIGRDEAMQRSELYSLPRIASIREYAQMIGLNCEEALSVINSAPRRY